MPRQYRSFTVTIPAGTQKSAPILASIGFPPFTVSEIDVLIPPGPNGRMGFQIAVSGTQVIPWNAGEWVVTNNERLSYQVDGYPDSGAWQLRGYNTGVYDHTIQVRFALDPVAPAPSATVAAVTTAQLSNVPDQTDAQTADAQAALDDLLAQVAAQGGAQ